MRVEVKGGGEDQLEFHLCAFQFLFKSSAEYIHSHTERGGEGEGREEVEISRQSFGLTGCALQCADCESKRLTKYKYQCPIHV